MPIDDADGLEVGIDDGGADEGHAAAFQVGGDGVGQGRGGTQGAGFPHHPAAGERPDIVAERAEFLLYRLEHSAVADGGLDLQPVADDGGVAQQ